MIYKENVLKLFDLEIFLQIIKNLIKLLSNILSKHSV